MGICDKSYSILIMIAANEINPCGISGVITRVDF